MKTTQGNTFSTTYRPGYETVADKIITLITTSGLQPGDRLPTEQVLGTQLGVSRAMVREAIKLLTASGYVRTRRGSGIYVTNNTVAERASAGPTIEFSVPADPAHIQHLFEFRLLQETLTVRLAAERITLAQLRALEEALELNRRGAERDQWDTFIEGDIAFHQGIANATHNPFLAETVATTFRLQRWTTKLIIGGTTGSLADSVAQHSAILQAIKMGNPDAAASAMQAHVQDVIAAYQQEVSRLLTGHTQNVVEQE